MKTSISTLCEEEIGSIVGGTQTESFMNACLAFLKGFVPVVLVGGGLWLFSYSLQKNKEKKA